MNLKEYTHANLKTPIVVDISKIFSVYYSSAHKSTMLLANAGAIIPVLESVDTVKSDLTNKPNEETK